LPLTLIGVFVQPILADGNQHRRAQPSQSRRTRHTKKI
jgi:hypothetical protein